MPTKSGIGVWKGVRMNEEKDITQELDPEWFEETTEDFDNSKLQHLVNTVYLECDEFYILYADLYYDGYDTYYFRQRAMETKDSPMEDYWYKSVNSEALDKLCDRYGI
jgi:hypothetical protein